MIGITSSGDNKKTSEYLRGIRRSKLFADLDRYGQMGVEVLSMATPVDSGLTANSWEYRIVRDRNGPKLEWYNTHVVSIISEVSIAVLIQYGHATGTGGYVVGRDFINPAMRPTFDKIAEDVWRRVKA